MQTAAIGSWTDELMRDLFPAATTATTPRIVSTPAAPESHAAPARQIPVTGAIPETITFPDGSVRRCDDVIREFMPAAIAVAHSMNLTAQGATHEDFESEACLALVEAVRAYDPKHGVVPLRWVRQRVRCHMIDVQRRLSARKRSAVGCDIDDPATEILVATDAHGRRVDPSTRDTISVDSLVMKDVVGRLPKFQRQVIHHLFTEERTEPEIARMYGVTEGTVRYHRRAAMKKLKRLLAPLAAE